MHGNGTGDNNSETGGWSDKILQIEWSFEKQRRESDEFEKHRRESDEGSLETERMKFENNWLVIGSGSTTPPLSMEEHATKGWKPSPSLPPAEHLAGDVPRQRKELASRTPDAGIWDRNSMYADSSRKQEPEKDILTSLSSDMYDLVDSVEEKGAQLLGDMWKQSGGESTSSR